MLPAAAAQHVMVPVSADLRGSCSRAAAVAAAAVGGSGPDVGGGCTSAALVRDPAAQLPAEAAPLGSVVCCSRGQEVLFCFLPRAEITGLLRESKG